MARQSECGSRGQSDGEHRSADDRDGFPRHATRLRWGVFPRLRPDVAAPNTDRALTELDLITGAVAAGAVAHAQVPAARIREDDLGRVTTAAEILGRKAPRLAAAAHDHLDVVGASYGPSDRGWGVESWNTIETGSPA